MAKSSVKNAVLAKIEATYKTDPTPTGVANAMRVSNLNLTPMNGDTLVRDYVGPYFRNFANIVVNSHVKADFEVELQSSGTLGTAPAFGPLLRACACGETVTASTKVEYAPVSTITDSVTMYFYKDGLVHKIVGMRGDAEVMLSAREVPTIKFSMTGIYAGPVDAALPAVTLTGFKNPVAAEKSNTSGFTFLGTSFPLESLSLKFGNEVFYRNLVGAEEVIITDRKPTGEILIDAPTVATYDFFTAAANGTTGALAIQHGQTGTLISTIDVGVLQVLQPSYEDASGTLMLKVPFIALPSSGNDDFKLTFK